MSLSPAISFESLTKQYELLGLSGEDADPQELQEQRKWLLRPLGLTREVKPKARVLGAQEDGEKKRQPEAY
ncbi:hypothetical protein Tco_0982819 [Tanacetum coccineum]